MPDMKPTHPTWLDERIEIRESSVHGRGAFATAAIPEGQVVTVWAHSILNAQQTDNVQSGETHRRANGSYVWFPTCWVPVDGYDVAEEYLNHSCDPNVWLEDEVTLSTRRAVSPGEELTSDYALWELKSDYVSPWECKCRSSLCRGRFTGQDWKLPELQHRYAGHFHPAIEARIAELYAKG
jgi:hypothetical protein